MNREFDFLVWGVTGYTGRLVASRIAKQCGPPGTQVNYALVARSQHRLNDVKELMRKEEGWNKDTAVQTFEMEVTDKDAVTSMVQRATVVIALSGPYCQCGENILEACAKTGTHYVDITGELPWVREMVDKYDSVAKTNKSIILPCCGFDYVPNEISLLHLIDFVNSKGLKFSEDTRVEQLVMSSGSGFSGGTMRTLDAIMEKYPTQNKDPFVLNSVKPDAATLKANQNYSGLHHNKAINKWTTPHVMGPSMCQYMRWSNEQLSFPFGKNWCVTVAGVKNSWASAVFDFSKISGALVTTIPGMPARLAKKSGEGPDVKASMNETTHLISLAKVGDKAVEVNLLYEHGGAYPLTAVTVLNTALALVEVAKGSGEGGYGVSTPGASIPEAFKKHIDQNGINVTVNFKKTA